MMRLVTTSFFGLMAFTGVAAACPAMNMSSGASMLSMAAISAGQTYQVTAGGENTLEQCGLGALGFAQFRSVPDVSFVPESGNQAVVLSVDSQCDPALLVNTADGAWHFNDDTNGFNPSITISNPAEMGGQIDVWVGTFAGNGCPAVLTVQAQGGGGIAQAPQPAAPQPAAPIPAPQPAPAPVPAPQPAPQPVPVPVPAPVIPAGCPNPDLIGPSLTLTGGQLTTPQAYIAQVTGGTSLDMCQIGDFWGSAGEAPQFTLNMSQMNGFVFSAELTSDCDPTLLLRDATGGWHFNDDGPNGLQPRLEVDGAMLNGQVDIWVGTFGGSECQGQISFQTVSGGGGGAAPMPTVGGCPNPQLTGVPVTTNGVELYSPDDYIVTAGGGSSISDCGVGGFGFAPAAPALTFNLSGMSSYGRLEIEGEGFNGCDITLLARTADGQWFFDDDSNGNLQPRLDLRNTATMNGRLDVWVGTFGGQTCQATVEMETWNN